VVVDSRGHGDRRLGLFGRPGTHPCGFDHSNVGSSSLEQQRGGQPGDTAAKNEDVEMAPTPRRRVELGRFVSNYRECAGSGVGHDAPTRSVTATFGSEHLPLSTENHAFSQHSSHTGPPVDHRAFETTRACSRGRASTASFVADAAGSAEPMTAEEPGPFGSRDLRALLESDLPEPVLVLGRGQPRVVSGHGPDSDGMEVVSRGQLIRQTGHTEFTDAELDRHAGALATVVDNLGALKANRRGAQPSIARLGRAQVSDGGLGNAEGCRPRRTLTPWRRTRVVTRKCGRPIALQLVI
jgi:hypothetical protein